MAIETETHPLKARPSLILDSVDLQVGHEIGLFVDSLGIDSGKVFITLQLKPTSENPDANNLLIIATDNQLDAFQHALDLNRQAVVDSMYQSKLRSLIGKGSLFSKKQEA